MNSTTGWINSHMEQWTICMHSDDLHVCIQGTNKSVCKQDTNQYGGISHIN